jgi:hypothetical protein
VEQFNLDDNVSKTVHKLTIEYSKVSLILKEIIKDKNIYDDIIKSENYMTFYHISKFVIDYKKNHDKLSEINYLADDLIHKVGQKLNFSEKNCLSEKLEDISSKSIEFLNYFSSFLDSIIKNKCFLEPLTVLDSSNNSLASENDLNAKASQGQTADQPSSQAEAASLEPVSIQAAAEKAAAEKAAAEKAAAEKAAAEKAAEKAAAEKVAEEKAATEKAAEEKAAAEKAAAEKAAEEKAVAEKAAAEKAAEEKAAEEKAAAEKAAAEKAAEEKAVAEKAAAEKAAEEKAAAEKAAAEKAAAEKAAAEETAWQVVAEKQVAKETIQQAASDETTRQAAAEKTARQAGQNLTAVETSTQVGQRQASFERDQLISSQLEGGQALHPNVSHLTGQESSKPKKQSLISQHLGGKAASQLATYPAPEKPKLPIVLLDYKVKFGLQDDPNEEPNSPLIFVHLNVKDIKKNISQIEWSLSDNISSFSQISASHKDFIEATFSFDNIFQIIGVSTNKYYNDNIGFKIEPMSNGTKIYMSGECPQGFDGMLNFKIVLVPLEKFVRKSVPFYIAPDPKTLWNDLPVEDYAGYEYPDEKFEGTKIALIDKNLTVASCRGRSHAHVGKPRDDNYHFVCDSNSGWNILAVADGAGSAVFSRKGSDIACQSVVGFLHKTLAAENVANFFDENHDFFLSWKNDFKASVINDNDRSFEEEFRSQVPLDNIIYKCVYEAWSNISKERTTRSEETNNEKVSLNDYNTTLLFTAFKKFDFGYFFMSFWIGDGGMAIVDVDKTGRVLVLGSPDSGEFAGQTRFLTTKGEIDLDKVKTRTYFSFADDFESVILVTDGITDPYFPSDEMVGSEDMWKEFWTKILRYGDVENPGCPEIYDKNLPNETRSEALRKWLDFWSKGNHDDRTILIVN